MTIDLDLELSALRLSALRLSQGRNKPRILGYKISGKTSQSDSRIGIIGIFAKNSQNFKELFNFRIGIIGTIGTLLRPCP